jgi:hypothetical protein
MFPALRTLASSKLAWFRIATTLAPGAVATTHTRTVTDKDGTARTQQVVRQPRYVVSNGALTTGEVFLKLALTNAQRVQATPALWTSVVMTDAGVPELPPLYTSGRELSQKRRVTDRTIRNHVRELKACGFITRYQFRGREHAYCVWINPDFVWEAALGGSESQKMSRSKPAESSPNSKNFPAKEFLDTQLETQNVEITRVEKLVTVRKPAVETGNPLTGNAGPQPGSVPAPQPLISSLAGPARRGARVSTKKLRRLAQALKRPKPRRCSKPSGTTPKV